MILSEYFSRPIDLCVQMLARDGLKVTPFDQHAEGDRGLRMLGLSVETWRQWLYAVMGAQAELNETGRVLAAETAGQDVLNPDLLTSLPVVRTAARPFLRAPSELCPGSDELRMSLARLWVDDRPRTEAARRRLGSPESTQQRSRGLWQQIDRFRASLSELVVYLIDYPVPAVMVVPPGSCLIAPGPDYVAQVVSAAEQLATWSHGDHLPAG